MPHIINQNLRCESIPDRKCRVRVSFHIEWEAAELARRDDYNVAIFLMGDDMRYDDVLLRFEGNLGEARGANPEPFVWESEILRSKLNEDVGGRDEVYARVELRFTPGGRPTTTARTNTIRAWF